MLLRRWGRWSKCHAGRGLTAKSDFAAQPARSIRLTALSALLETFTDPLSRHPEPPDVHRLLESRAIRTFMFAVTHFDDARGGVREQEYCNMFRLYWLRLGRATLALPRCGRIHRERWPTLGLVACMALFLSGCQSGPFSNCGTGCGSGLFSPCGFFGRVSSRVFNRSNGAAGCCTPGVVSDGAVEYATPSTVVTPGTTSSPSYPTGVGTTTSPSYPAPLPGEEPANLSPADPIPKVEGSAATQRHRRVRLASGQQDELSNSSPRSELTTRTAAHKTAPDDGFDA